MTESDRHRLLAAEHRRIALDLLEKREAPIDLAELAAGVASRQDGTTAPGSEVVERVAVALHHNHLPKMAAVGVIDYDPASKRIEDIRSTF